MYNKLQRSGGCLFVGTAVVWPLIIFMFIKLSTKSQILCVVIGFLSMNHHMVCIIILRGLTTFSKLNSLNIIFKNRTFIIPPSRRVGRIFFYAFFAGVVTIQKKLFIVSNTFFKFI